MDIVIWVGKSYYKTREDFIQEAASIGVMRRIPRVPNVELGKSKCFLIYEDEKDKPEVFGYFTIRSIGCAVREGVKLSKELEKRGVKPIYVGGPTSLPYRGCGAIVLGGFYVLSEEDFEKCKDLMDTDKTEVEGSLMLLKPPKPWKGKHFRGFTYVKGEEILDGAIVTPVIRVEGKWRRRYKTLDHYA